MVDDTSDAGTDRQLMGYGIVGLFIVFGLAWLAYALEHSVVDVAWTGVLLALSIATIQLAIKYREVNDRAV